MQTRRNKQESTIKTYVLIFVTGFVALLIICRLFYLQIIQYSYYIAEAEKDHQANTELPARRGEIFITDYHSGEKFRLATNTTLDLIFADPTLIKNKQLVAEKITEIIYDVAEERAKDNERIYELNKKINDQSTEEQRAQLQPLTDSQLYEKFYQNVLQAISNEKRPEIMLSNTVSSTALQEISNKNLTGVGIKDNSIYVYPPLITNVKELAVELSPYLDMPTARLERILIGENRYVVLKKKLKPEFTQKIRDLKSNDPDKNFLGIGIKEEYYRYYPEETMAANVLGFVDQNGNGQYGIESKFNKELQGKNGIFQTQIDSTGRQITVGDSIIEPAVNGDNVTLTIDRSIQMEVETKLAQKVKQYDADSGQVIIMEPKTGKIIAMANYPTFDPNDYNKVFDKEIINLTPEQIKELIPVNEDSPDPSQFYLYRNKDTYDKFDVFKELDEAGNYIYKRYKNFYGPEAYQNKTVSGIYEPGSVMKSVTMAIGLDDNDITPNETFNEDGPLEIDGFPIRNSLDQYRGIQTMTNIIENSSNTGIAYITRKIGRTLLYNYFLKFGFGERTEIEFENELPGQLEHASKWAESELVTRGFGQGIAVTPIQMITAYAVLANKGLLVKPYIVDSIEKQDGKIIKTEPKILHRVIDEKTADTITAMLISSVENGVANKAQVPGHYIAGKTGTSQTYKNGKPLEGPGTTITSFAGYAPVDDPKFVILIKTDRPRKDVWGSNINAPLFAEIADYLFKYYSIPKDK